jgi:hypothetical protein
MAMAPTFSIEVVGNMKIEKLSQRGKTTVRLSGHFQADHIGELHSQLQDNGPRFVLDLNEVTLVDVEVVRLLGACEAKGVEIVHCPKYIREWINRERGHSFGESQWQ